MAQTLQLPTPAVAAYTDGHETAISSQLVEVASHSPHRTREFAEVAARAVASHFCEHERTPCMLPDFSTRAEALRAVQHHPGLCGVQHAGTIAGVKLRDVLDRGHEATGNKIRNQACFDAAKAMNAKGAGVQLQRKDCFTEACRALWPGKELLHPTLRESFM